MVTRKIGNGIIVSTAEPQRETAPRFTRPKPAPPTDFFSAHGISPPSSLFDTMSDTFYFAKDLTGRFVWGNRLLQKKQHLPRAEDFIGKRDHDFLRCDIADRIRADDLAVMSGEAVIDNKLEVIGKENGMFSWLCTSKRPLRNGRGEVIGIEGVSRDIVRAEDIAAPYRAFKDAMEYLQQHFTRGISIEQLARLSCMSLSTFERKFKQHFSVTPKQYILHMRVQEACRMLPGHPNIDEVAAATGFGGESRLNRQFSSVLGITPREYQLSVSAAEK
jgi:AraC-like DNA-binding protein